MSPSYPGNGGRLHELYSAVSADFTVPVDEHVDEHRQHALMLAQLRELKSSTQVTMLS